MIFIIFILLKSYLISFLFYVSIRVVMIYLCRIVLSECCLSLHSHTKTVKEQIEDKTTSLLVQIDNRIRILVMLQIMMLNISSPVYVITKISAIISRYLTAKFEQ